jgi:hypothetical protein
VPLLLTIALATGAVEPSGLVEAARERIGVAAGTRCPKAVADEIVVCGARGGERLRYALPLPREPVKGVPGREAVFEERNRWLELGKSGIGSETPVGPGGEMGRNLNALMSRVHLAESWTAIILGAQ